MFPQQVALASWHTQGEWTVQWKTAAQCFVLVKHLLAFRSTQRHFQFSFRSLEYGGGIWPVTLTPQGGSSVLDVQLKLREEEEGSRRNKGRGCRDESRTFRFLVFMLNSFSLHAWTNTTYTIFLAVLTDLRILLGCEMDASVKHWNPVWLCLSNTGSRSCLHSVPQRPSQIHSFRFRACVQRTDSIAIGNNPKGGFSMISTEVLSATLARLSSSNSVTSVSPSAPLWWVRLLLPVSALTAP